MKILRNQERLLPTGKDPDGSPSACSFGAGAASVPVPYDLIFYSLGIKRHKVLKQNCNPFPAKVEIP